MPLSKKRNRERMQTLRAVQPSVQPKYEVGYLYPDGRVRLPDMSLVQPNQCVTIKMR